MFYLLVAISQFIPVLQIGYVFTSVAPLVMVLTITMAKEAYDDYKRMRRDRSLNNESILHLTSKGFVSIPASKLEVGMIIKVKTNQRLPADCLLLKSYDESGTCFLRTDQLDGETDWKLRKASACTQRLSDMQIFKLDGRLEIEAPRKDIYQFEARLEAVIHHASEPEKEAEHISANQEVARDYENITSIKPAVDGDFIIPVNEPSVPTRSGASSLVHSASVRSVVEGVGLEQSLWCHTVLASSQALCIVIYTGRETRPAMNQSQPRNKIGLFELEVNSLSKQLCFMLTIASFLLLVGKGYSSIWYVYLIRFILLLSAIVPISLRVNLDMAKLFYSRLIQTDMMIPGTIVRTSTIPEELGRIDFLLTDKTGTLTKNEMIFKKLHLGSELFTSDRMQDLVDAVKESFDDLFLYQQPSVSGNYETKKNLLTNDDGSIAKTNDNTLDSPRKISFSANGGRILNSDILADVPSNGLYQSENENGNTFNNNTIQKNNGKQVKRKRNGSKSALYAPMESTKVAEFDVEEGGRKYSAYFDEDEDDDHKNDLNEDSNKVHSPWNTKSPSPLKNQKNKTMAFNKTNSASKGLYPAHVLNDLRQAVLTLALCHNVTVVKAIDNNNNTNQNATPINVTKQNSIENKKKTISSSTIVGKTKASTAPSSPLEDDLNLPLSFTDPLNQAVEHQEKHQTALKRQQQNYDVEYPSSTDIMDSFQAASPDEVALVKLAREVGLCLVDRNDKTITLETPQGNTLQFEVLFCFPFSSETKKMGIIVREKFTANQIRSSWNPQSGLVNPTNLKHDLLSGTSEILSVAAAETPSSKIASEQILLLVKGAESVMIERLRTRGSEWLGEECDTLAREGLRTLVFGCRELSQRELSDFSSRYHDAKSSMRGREARVARCIESLESPLRLLALTGVEDCLQDDVAHSIESMRHAGIKIWLLTGDKVETAICIAISAGLKPRTHGLAVISCDLYPTETARLEALERFSMAPDHTVLVLDGGALATLLLSEHISLFIHAASRAPSVVCCRCSPTQKAEVVKAIKSETGRRTCAIGDGGNDVAMILAADVGIGIEGKEGKQASLAADFSIMQFCYLTRLLMWHGRNSFVRSSSLCQFVVHRGLIISVIQVLFSSIFFFIPLPVFQGALQMGYTTIYTTFPVFALVYDEMLPYGFILQYPELYDSLRKGRQMGPKVFWLWMLQSVYQGSVIILLSLILFTDNFMNVVAISFSALVLSELLNVATEVHSWYPKIIAAEILSLLIYVISLFFLPAYFDLQFVLTTDFVMKVCAIVAVSWGPPHLLKILRRKLRPSQHDKLVFVSS